MIQVSPPFALAQSAMPVQTPCTIQNPM